MDILVSHRISSPNNIPPRSDNTPAIDSIGGQIY